MNYLEFDFKVTPTNPGVELLIAELGSAGFESFEENDQGVKAYIPTDEFRDDILEYIHVLHSDEFSISYTSQEIKQVNWNKEWEKNFHPIVVGDKCSIRAPFHAKPDTRYDIVIEPKMSFGTGHHATTHLMIEFLLKEELQGKEVLDMGCGTGVLGILAEMRGAKSVTAIDIDNWCYLNSQENAQRNACSRMEIIEGGAELLSGRKFDVIIANINRNILLQDMEAYSKSLRAKGELFLSGFYEADIPVIQKVCEQNDLRYIEHRKQEEWVAVKFYMQ